MTSFSKEILTEIYIDVFVAKQPISDSKSNNYIDLFKMTTENVLIILFRTIIHRLKKEIIIFRGSVNLYLMQSAKLSKLCI